MSPISKHFKSLSLASIYLGILSTAGCGALTSSDAALGTVAGTGIGSAIGAAIGAEHGHMTANVLANGAIGAGVGWIGGAILNGFRPDPNSPNTQHIVERRAVYINEQQREIDRLRAAVDEQSKWGRNESKPWKERYVGENSNYPYQGPSVQPSGLNY